MTGAYREEYPPNGERQVYNTIYAIGDDGTILDAYDKVHLVPFGEYLPAGEFLERYGVRAADVREPFSPGPFRRSIDATLRAAVPAAHLLRDHLLRRGARRRAAAGLHAQPDERRLVRPHAPGPTSTSIRRGCARVEEGLPLVRAANTGISAVIDAYGRTITVSRLGEATMIEARLPAAIPPPFYAQWRDAMFLLSLAVCLLAVSQRFFTERPLYD